MIKIGDCLVHVFTGKVTEIKIDDFDDDFVRIKITQNDNYLYLKVPLEEYTSTQGVSNGKYN